MPTLRIARQRLREKRVTDDESFIRAFGPELRANGFRLDLPILRESLEDSLALIQDDPPDRIQSDDAHLQLLLSQIDPRHQNCINALHAYLVEKGDDRAKVMEEMEGGGADAEDSLRHLCLQTLVLFGIRPPNEGV